MFKLASWNVNSLKVRLPQVLDWLSDSETDVLAIQETKVTDENFPLSAFAELGYHVEYFGQKTYNGVAFISKHPMQEVLKGMPGMEDEQRRVLGATIAGCRIINLYVPNGYQVTSEKFLYKMNWLQQINDFIKQQLAIYPKLAVVGDFNIAPEDRDVHDPLAWEGQVLVSTQERQAFSSLLALGLVDSYRNFPSIEPGFSWWDYRAGSFRRNHGLRIDHILLSHELNKQCSASCIDIAPRRGERPSDHAPVWVSL